MSRISSTTTAEVPAWGRIQKLGYKPALYLASKDRQRGVVLLISPQDPSLKGIAWWDGDCDPERLKAQITWSRSPMTLHSWATRHSVASQFGPLLHLISEEVRRTSN